MIYFNCDYNEGAHPHILQKLSETNLEQTPGYGEDAYCKEAADLIRTLCHCPDAAVHFLVGGTQANLTVISSALRPYQGVLCADTGHIHLHETGAVEATGHKVLSLPSVNGKISARQIQMAYYDQANNDAFEHIVQPKMVYLSSPSELGTLYSRKELEEIHNVCRECGLYLFLDGARLSYGLAAEENDLALADLASFCDVFYMGGTKCGALFGEAVVIINQELQKDFRYMIKQKGGMLAKGRLLGIQFVELLKSNMELYLSLAKHADRLADQIRYALTQKGYPYLVETTANQIFVILPDKAIAALTQNFSVTYQCRVDDSHSAIRICTSWATRTEDVDSLIHTINTLPD
ncbi:MAG: aminotransferase class I/II-fold pyridoxal phosphate-dependent enzyme [Fusicatenibacter sp.]|nr:aminotransferase class I/II-fold pyridoxal phosphate-dependent enzyme [Fusicatenibacter sp.]